MYVPSPEITVKGGQHVCHFQGVPYNDVGADATVTFADGTSKPERVETVPNSVPSGFEKPGKYEVKYEAFASGCKCCGCTKRASSSGPWGTYDTMWRILELQRSKCARATRVVEIGSYILTKYT